jgi:glucose/arabinose dehydrogenase
MRWFLVVLCAGLGGSACSSRNSGGGPRTASCVGPASATLTAASVPQGYCAWTWATGLGTPRGATTNGAGDLLVVERSSASVTLLHDDNGDGVSDASERISLGTAPGLNHGIAVGGGFLYASSSTTVYRWAYSGGRAPLGQPTTVVTGIPSGGHSTRTLAVDRAGMLYVSVGSGSNVDANSSRARIVRYPASALAGGATFASGELFADGLRNEVGVTIDGRGRVWGVENGLDDLTRTDLGGDIHEDNPTEELNLFATPGRFYGYPYCWTEYNLPQGVGAGRGAQWAHPQFMNDGMHTDAWCKNTANVVPPRVSMQGHSAPLDVLFYAGSSFPADVVGDAIVSFHGSWNRTAATGYKVVRIPFGGDGNPAGDPVPLLESAADGDTGGDWPHRPVGLAVGKLGQLLVTSDDTGVVIAVGHMGG